MYDSEEFVINGCLVFFESNFYPLVKRIPQVSKHLQHVTHWETTPHTLFHGHDGCVAHNMALCLADRVLGGADATTEPIVKHIETNGVRCKTWRNVIEIPTNLSVKSYHTILEEVICPRIHSPPLLHKKHVFLIRELDKLPPLFVWKVGRLMEQSRHCTFVLSSTNMSMVHPGIQKKSHMVRVPVLGASDLAPLLGKIAKHMGIHASNDAISNIIKQSKRHLHVALSMLSSRHPHSIDDTIVRAMVSTILAKHHTLQSLCSAKTALYEEMGVLGMIPREILRRCAMLLLKQRLCLCKKQELIKFAAACDTSLCNTNIAQPHIDRFVYHAYDTVHFQGCRCEKKTDLNIDCSYNAITSTPVIMPAKTSAANVKTVAAAPASPSPAKKMVKKQPAKKAEKPVEETPAEETPAEETPAEETPAEEEVCPYEAKVSQLLEDLAQVTLLIKTLQTNAKAISKDVKALVKKTTKKKSKATGPRKSGFEKEITVSDELYDFLGVERGASVTRLQVTKAVNKYIKDNSLENPDDRRIILPNDELKKILSSTEETVTYFTLPKLMKHHFTPATV